MKRDGVEFEERIARLEEVEWPKPGSDFIYSTFNDFVTRHAWVGEDGIRPKCIAREMLENYVSFDDYVRTYKLERSEGVLLRHVSEVYKVLSQTVPVSARTEEVEEAELFFFELLKGVDSSLIEEWERLRNPELSATRVRAEPQHEPPSFTRDRKAFMRRVRHEVFAFLKALPGRDLAGEPEWLGTDLECYLAGHRAIRLDPEARNLRNTLVEERDGELIVEQILLDPDEANDWSFKFAVDLRASGEAEAVVMRAISLEPFVR